MHPLTEKYSSFVKVLNRWMSENLDSRARPNFRWTTIAVSCDSLSAKHRDRNNAGLSAIASFGQFTGGGLFLWPNDQGTKETKINDLKCHDAHQQVVLFKGCQAHGTEDYQGIRVSVI